MKFFNDKQLKELEEVVLDGEREIDLLKRKIKKLKEDIFILKN